MEHKFVEMAKEMLKNLEYKQVALLRRQVHNKSSARNQSGMICSGEQTNLVYSVQSNDIEVVEKIIGCLEEEKSGLLQLSPRGLRLSDEMLSQRYCFDFQNESEWTYQEVIGYKSNLFIIGGGHCALALSRIMSMMDFRIHVIDTRPGLNTVDQNHSAHRKYLLGDYSELAELIPSDANQFIVVMTFGYRTDEIAVKALLSKEFMYFGLLGSEKKVKTLFADLVNEGFSRQQVERIHAPVGLPINSQTPEEIAISIAAQIVAVKNKYLKTNHNTDPGEVFNNLAPGSA